MSLQDLEARIAALEKRVSAHEANQCARLENSHTWKTNSLGLRPLRAVATNATIPNFPYSAAALDSLGGGMMPFANGCRGVRLDGEVNRILSLLGVAPEGALGAKRRVLRALVGVFG
ncbi:hypothetical protein F5X98DRAFT_374400 [Xylaria grammica]|nr:hypothetical protein F5X98DRAFT_374400 [Xylaria grammica]